MAAHVATSGHALCKCGGYHFAHRPGSPMCESNPICDLWRAMRQGEEMGVLREIAEYLGSPAARKFLETYCGDL